MRRMGRMTRSTILPVSSPNVTAIFKNRFTGISNDKFVMK